ncbi:MAG: hypothetical protein U5J83_18730 [Bryobacterales bacterium]|nr:hypothetical protein [Bryobacterales bacterium]
MKQSLPYQFYGRASTWSTAIKALCTDFFFVYAREINLPAEGEIQLQAIARISFAEEYEIVQSQDARLVFSAKGSSESLMTRFSHKLLSQSDLAYAAKMEFWVCNIVEFDVHANPVSHVASFLSQQSSLFRRGHSTVSCGKLEAVWISYEKLVVGRKVRLTKENVKLGSTSWTEWDLAIMKSMVGYDYTPQLYEVHSEFNPFIDIVALANRNKLVVEFITWIMTTLDVEVVEAFDHALRRAHDEIPWPGLAALCIRDVE